MKKIILLTFCLLIIPKLAIAGSFCSGAGKSVKGSGFVYFDKGKGKVIKGFDIDDPSNKNDKFLRVKVRNLISKLEKEGLTLHKFKNSLNNLNRSNYALEHYVQKNIYYNSTYLKLKKAIVLNEDFFKQPQEIVLTINTTGDLARFLTIEQERRSKLGIL